MCERNNLELISYPPYLDSKSIADRLVKEHWLRASGMDYLCKHYKVILTGKAHTALVDCERTIEVWDKLQADIGNQYEIFTYEHPYERKRY